MKKGTFFRKGILYLVVLALLSGQTSVAYAAQPSAEPITEVIDEPTEEPDNESTEEIVEEVTGEASEEPTADVIEDASKEPDVEIVEDESEAPSDEPLVEVIEEPIEEPTEEPTEEPIGEPVEEPIDESIDERYENLSVKEGLFPGLSKDYVLSDEQVEEKAQLNNQISEISNLAEGRDYKKGQILVNVNDEETAELFAAAFDAKMIGFYGDFALLELVNGSENAITVLDAVIESADENTALPAAWPNYIYHVGVLSEDSYPAEQEAALYTELMVNTEQALQTSGEISGDTDLKEQWHHVLLDTEVLWRNGYTGVNATVAVLSTGVNNHNEFQRVIHNSTSALGTEDTDGRGTYLASLIAGERNNSKEASGIATGATIYNAKISNGETTTTTDVLDALNAVSMNQATYAIDVVLLDFFTHIYDKNIETKIEELYQKGVAVFCPAGDAGGNGTWYPAAYKHAYGVTALNPNKSRMQIANYGKNVRYAAPGGDYDPGLNYSGMNKCGTAHAAALVTGQAAVLLSNGKVTGTGAEKVDNLIALMDKNCVVLSGSGMGKGMVNLPKACNIVTTDGTPKKPVFDLKAGTYNSNTITLSLSAQDGCEIYYSDNGKDVTLKNGLMENGTLYQGPITIGNKNAVTIKAISYNTYNKKISKIATAKYTFRPPVESIRVISQSGTSLVKKGKTLKLKAVYTPTYAKNRSVTWHLKGKPKGISIDKNGVISVSSGAKTGVYTAYAKTKNGKTCDFVFDVIPTPKTRITKITSPKTSYTFNTGDMGTIPLTVKRINAQPNEVYNDVKAIFSNNLAVGAFSADNSSIMYMIGNKPGKFKITAYAQEGSDKKFTINVTVKQPVTQIDITGEKETKAGKTIQLSKKVWPENATNKKVKWSVVTDTKEVTVDQKGKVTVSQNAPNGIYEIKCKALDGSGIERIFNFEVKKPFINTLAIEKTEYYLSRNFEGSFNFGVLVNGVIGDYKNWVVTSDKPNIATAKNGLDGYIDVDVTGKGTGTVNVTAKATDGSGKKANLKVHVVNYPSSLTISLPAGRGKHVAKGQTLQLSALLGDNYGPLGSGTKVTWQSNGKDLTIDETGKVKVAKSAYGTYTITARAVCGDRVVFKETMKLQVDNNYTAVKLKDESKGKYLTNRFTIKKNQDYVYKPYMKWEGGSGFESVSTREVRYSVDKPGMTVYSDNNNNTVIRAAKKGTYKVTISFANGSKAKKEYTIVVK